jgi:hypothetical protein
MQGWKHESRSAAASPSASAYAARSAPADRQRLAEEAEYALYAPRGLREARPGAGLAALLELDEIPRFAAATYRFEPNPPVTVSLAGFLTPDWWLASRAVAHYGELKRALGDSLLERISEHRDAHNTWDLLAPFAAQQPTAREDLLSFIRSHGAGSHAGLLRFLAAVRPRSRELLDVLLKEANSEIGHRGHARDGLLTSLDLLAEHYGSDQEALAHATDVAGAWPPEQRVLVFLLCWPEKGRAELNAHGPLTYPFDLWVRIELCRSDPEVALESFARYVSEQQTEGPMARPPVRQLVRRLRRDSALRAAMERRLRGDDAPSVFGGWARMLATVGGLTGASREVVTLRCDEALEGNDVDTIALDLMALQLRPLAHILFEALHGNVT